MHAMVRNQFAIITTHCKGDLFKFGNMAGFVVYRDKIQSFIFDKEKNEMLLFIIFHRDFCDKKKKQKQKLKVFIRMNE